MRITQPGDEGYRESIERQRRMLYNTPSAYESNNKEKAFYNTEKSEGTWLKYLFLLITAPVWLPLYILWKFFCFVGLMGGGGRHFDGW